MLTSKLIDGTFPDYQRVIPAGNDKMLGVDGRTLAAAVDRVSTITTDKLRAVKLALERDRLTVSATSPDQGSATEELAVAYQGGAIQIGFNARYLLDILSQIKGEEARFAFADATSPVIARDSEEAGALYVLMPMRVYDWRQPSPRARPRPIRRPGRDRRRPWRCAGSISPPSGPTRRSGSTSAPRRSR